MARDPIDLLHGTLDVLVLKTLSWGPMHGYGISRWIEERTRGVLEIEDAALYKSLHRLERAGSSFVQRCHSERSRAAAEARNRRRPDRGAWPSTGEDRDSSPSGLRPSARNDNTSLTRDRARRR